MTYVMSDLHGRYEQYAKMLERIRFSEQDELYILGDVVDRGPQPIRILLDMSARPNVHPILGNHELMAIPLLAALSSAPPRTAEAETAMEKWLSDGGETTLAGFLGHSSDDRVRILDYLGSFVPYRELTVEGAQFILVHAGMDDFDPNRPLCTYSLRSLVTAHTDYTRRYFPDRYLVTGHIPTGLIAPGYGGRIYRANGHIAMDCGNGWGGTLGCLRLEDMEEFYVAP